MLSEVLFILMFLASSSLVVHDVEAKSKVKLSKKYTPLGNPGGASFHADEDFAESYKLYEKRRELLKKKKLQDRADININKENLAKKLKEKKIANLSDELNDTEACIIDDEENAMVNHHGINIARLKGAVFIDDLSQEPVLQSEDEQRGDEKREEKGITSAREKKVSPINVTVKENSPKRMCSHDSIADLSLNGSDSFGSVADVVE